MSGDSSPHFQPSMRDALTACSPRHADDRLGLCAYPSKPCPNARATKLNGDRHNFCEMHRKKANMNQRRWQQRRRRMRNIGDSSPSATTAPARCPEDPESPHASNADMESAQAVMMLHQSPPDAGRYSPVPVHSWPRYPPVANPHEWAPRRPLPSVAHQFHHYDQQPHSYSPTYTTRPSIESPLARGSPYTYAPRPLGDMIPPLRSLPLPTLLPSVLVPRSKSSSSPRVVGAARVYTC